MYYHHVLYIHCMYFVCTLFVQCSYNVRTVFVQRMFRNEFVHTSFIFFRTISKLSVLSTYFVHQCTRLKASQQHIPINQSIHSNHHAFGFAPLPFAEGAAGCGRRIGRPRVRAGRAGRAGLRRSATAPAALASAAARPRWLRWPPLQRSTLLPNRRSVGRTSPTVLTIHRAAMDLSWSRMCCGDVDVATKIGDRRYYFSIVLCSNNQQLLKHNDMKLCGNVT